MTVSDSSGPSSTSPNFGEWAEYLDSVNSELEKADEDGLDSGSERVVGLVLNRGHAELKLGLGRKAVASAQLALRSGPCLKACLLKAKFKMHSSTRTVCS